MTETEGVIKFDLHFHSSPVEPSRALDELLQWRDVFFRLGVIGQDPARYEGFAYGNISHRSGSGNQFIISGSQTGGLTSCLAENQSCRSPRPNRPFFRVLDPWSDLRAQRTHSMCCARPHAIDLEKGCCVGNTGNLTGSGIRYAANGARDREALS